ncbi:hypothetical protein LCGC14_2178350 [marine sediment metagenome]|uniref:Uncharacterized protein n=1 Tax=marine sediment metagenome TaxID=412755 RepID=A0A0F9DN19_9ZZZZ
MITAKPRCPQCGQQVALELDYGKFRCRRCKTVFSVGERPLDKAEAEKIT